MWTHQPWGQTLLAFRADYPMARVFLVHPGTKREHVRGVEVLPMSYALQHLDELLGAPKRRTNDAKAKRGRL